MCEIGGWESVVGGGGGSLWAAVKPLLLSRSVTGSGSNSPLDSKVK